MKRAVAIWVVAAGAWAILVCSVVAGNPGAVDIIVVPVNVAKGVVVQTGPVGSFTCRLTVARCNSGEWILARVPSNQWARFNERMVAARGYGGQADGSNWYPFRSNHVDRIAVNLSKLRHQVEAAGEITNVVEATMSAFVAHGHDD